MHRHGCLSGVASKLTIRLQLFLCQPKSGGDLCLRVRVTRARSSASKALSRLKEQRLGGVGLEPTSLRYPNAVPPHT